MNNVTLSPASSITGTDYRESQYNNVSRSVKRKVFVRIITQKIWLFIKDSPLLYS